MHKKVARSLCFLLIAICIVFIGASEAKAAEAKSVQVSIPEFQVTINGQVIENKYNQYPMLVYNNITYLPLTYYNCRFLGIKIVWYENKQVFFIGSDSIAESKLKTYSTQAPNRKKYIATIPNYKTAVNTINSNEFLDNEEESYPILNFRGITYLPLTGHFAVDKFDWKYAFDSQTGLCIDSRDAIRPVLRDSKIGDSSPMRGLRRMQYVFSNDAYAGYPISTLDGFYKLAYRKRGETEKTFSLEEQLIGGDYYFNCRLDTNGYCDPNADIKPSLDGNILSVVCVIKSGELYKGENMLLKIDMEAEKIISQESIPLMKLGFIKAVGLE
ncbi:MAG: hypothetical protein PHI90_08800 [Clostridia bacterium]|nr:hypothetical protein [Clostridia bacterium]MDD4048899.1 hypothetical protein [Clostridia bacterium]